MGYNYYTKEGLDKLKAELEHMKSVERPRISDQIAEARDKGDLSEKAEYDAAKEAQGLLEMKISKLEDAIANAISWLNPKGKIIMHNMINEHEIDIFIKYSRSSDSYNVNELESGWNVISEKSLSLVCQKYSAKLVEIKPFKIGVDIKPNRDDVMRSWTELDRNGNRQIYNALHIRQPQKIAIIEKI